MQRASTPAFAKLVEMPESGVDARRSSGEPPHITWTLKAILYVTAPDAAALDNK